MNLETYEHAAAIINPDTKQIRQLATMYRTFLFLLSFIGVSYAQSKEVKEIVACIDDHPPYQILADKPYGTHISALEVLANILDKQLKFVKSPNFARCVALLKKGQVDVIAGLAPTEARKKFAFYAKFKAADDVRIISRDNITIKKYDDLHGKIIGVARGTYYFPKFDKDETLKKISIQNSRIGFSLLAKGRIDLIMAGEATIKALSKEIKENDLTVSPLEIKEFRNKETPFGFSKKHKLGFTNQEIIEMVEKAYQQGRFNSFPLH